MNESTLRTVPIQALRVSATNAQAERRKHLDKVALQELADSIKSVGVLSPPLVRPLVNGTIFEIVFGERRYLAAKLAKLQEMEVSVRDLTDNQVLEIQLVENLQREGIHELAEAEGYEQLIKLGRSADEIAAKVGRSRGYVYGRMKLLDLCKEARAAFYDGKVSASIALQLARIPHESLQKEALKDLCDWGKNHHMAEAARGEMPSTRAASEHIQRHYMLALAAAPFPINARNLVPGVPACPDCPKNTISQPELFADISNSKKSAGVCTDPICFGTKRDAYSRERIQAARAQGQRVIEGKAAESATRSGMHAMQDGIVNLDQRCQEDPRRRTYRQLLGKDFKPALLVVPQPKGRPTSANYDDDEDVEPVMVEVADKAEIGELLKAKGIKREQHTRAHASSSDIARERKRKIEIEFRAELYEAMREKFATTLGRVELNAIALGYCNRLEHEYRKRLFDLWEWTPARTSWGGMDYEKPALENIPKLTAENLAVFLQDCVCVRDLVVGYGNDKPERMLTLAKHLKVNIEGIRKRVTAELTAKIAAKKSAKKPSAAKKK